MYMSRSLTCTPNSQMLLCDSQSQSLMTDVSTVTGIEEAGVSRLPERNHVQIVRITAAVLQQILIVVNRRG